MIRVISRTLVMLEGVSVVTCLQERITGHAKNVSLLAAPASQLTVVTPSQPERCHLALRLPLFGLIIVIVRQ